MKKLILILTFFSSLSFAQLSGEIANDKRKITTNITYEITGNQAGKFVFEIAVDMEGKVTSCVVLKNESTIVSTPLQMKAKNQIITGLTFERGYQFPEFHRGTVTIHVVKE